MKILWWRKSHAQITEEQYIEGFHEILQSERQRRKMSSAQLAISLSKCEKDSPAYFLFSHELNRRIAKVQALPAYLSLVMTVIGIFIGWGLSQWKPLESKEYITTSNKITSKDIATQALNDNAKVRLAPKDVLSEPVTKPKYEVREDYEDKASDNE